ncbi:MAG: CHAP domain-containing protein [Acidimicrobiales bacterium]
MSSASLVAGVLGAAPASALAPRMLTTTQAQLGPKASALLPPLIPPSPPPTGSQPTPPPKGRFANSGVLTYGDAAYFGSPTGLSLSSPIMGMAPTPDGKGYWLVAADGGIFNYGDAAQYGSAGAIDLQAPIVGMAPTPDGKGYWMVAVDGGIFSFGDAAFYGSTGAIHLNQPIVGMAPTPSGHGYWLVASDGGIFAFGDAAFYGSMGATTLNSPVVGMATTPGGHGYWLVAGDGGIFAFGDAGFYGSMGGAPLNSSVAGMAATATGKGYWMVGSDGGVFTFGDAGYHGSNAEVVPTPPVAGIVATHDGAGYWMLEPDAFPTSFSHPGPTSSFGGAGQIVAAAASQVNGNPSSGYLCNPYGPCEEWCALFATWAWEQAGVPIPRYPFTGDVYNWAAARGLALSPGQTPAPGDAVLYGSGPSNTGTSVHMGIVAQVWPDGAIITIEGDSGPGPDGHHNVTINGPFLPSQSPIYNGYAIYAYAHP